MHDDRARTTARGPLQSPHEKLLLDSPTCETMIWPRGSCPHELSIHRSGPVSPIDDPKQSAGRTRGTQTRAAAPTLCTHCPEPQVRHLGRIEEFSQAGSRWSAAAGRCGWTRNRNDISDRFPDIVAAAEKQLPDGVVLDGELVILGPDGRLTFDALQQRLVTSPAKARAKAAQLPAAYAAFDLLAIGGIDLRTQLWTARRQRLEHLAARWALPLQLTPVTSDVDEPTEWFEVLPAAMGVEGLVVKGASTRYTPGRRDAWARSILSGSWCSTSSPRGTCDQVSIVRGELACERHLSDTLPTAICCHAARVTCASSRWRRDGRRGPRHALTEVPELDHRDRPRRGP